MMLSPLAHPFHPTGTMESFQIFNDGIPSLTPVGTDLIRGFSDETMDECFPPTAQDIAELEAVEEFLHTLVRLEQLEEREERVRHDISILPKRWAVRRELQGKPRPARSAERDGSHSRYATTEDELKIIIHDRKQRDFNAERMEHHHSHRDNIVSKNQAARSNRIMNGKRTTRPIIQPRKGY